MEGLSGFALAGYLNDLERQQKKAASAIDTHSKSMSASEDYQGAQKRTDNWLASLSPEDLGKVDPSTKKVASNFEGVGDVSRFDADRSAKDLGLTSKFAGMPEVQAYFKSNQDVLSKKKDAEINKALEEALSEMNRNKQAQGLNELEEQAGVPKGNYNLSTPRDISVKYGLPKYEDKRVDRFMSDFVVKPEEEASKRLNDPYKAAQMENMKTRAKYLEYQMENANPEKRAQIQAELMALKESLGRDTDYIQEDLRRGTDEINYNRDPKPTYADLQTDKKAKVQDFGEDTTVDSTLSFVKNIREDSGGAYGLDPRRLLEAVDGTSEFVFKTKVEQLKNLLTLAERGKLKGQGAVSDMETEMLRKATTMLSTKLNKKDFVAELGRVEAFLNKQKSKPKIAPVTTPGITPSITPEPVKPTSEYNPDLVEDETTAALKRSEARRKEMAELRAKISQSGGK